VIDLLRALVDHFVANPGDLPPSAVEGISDGSDKDDVAGSPVMIHAAVSYVGGMTDRFACRSGLNLLGWAPQQLPDGLGLD
jgi:dGTPase